jgi:two-component system, NarL family, response regulator NreC
MITILLAEDHQVVRQGLSALLKAEPGFTVIGETGDGLEAVQLAERHKPDILIVDLKLPGLGGLEIVRQVSQRSRRTHCIVLSMYANAAYVHEALQGGAAGYLSKDSGADELVEAVRQVSAGRRYLSAPLSEAALDAYAKKASGVKLDPYETLTSREREVLHLLAEGQPTAEIALRLGISRRTVEAHRARVMKKLALSSQAELARFAIQRGILPLEE